jgi:hypothetical protein
METPMLTMNYWTDKWDLHEDICPCDVHFNHWAAETGVKNAGIFHFGTGTHHVIGLEQSRNGAGNVVVGITASIEEYDAYVKLVAEKAQVSKHYLAYFGDIYLTNARLLPRFDVVTMFHLCEFFFPNTASAEYGGYTDLQLLELFTDQMNVGGHVLFYTRSIKFGDAEKVIAEWEKTRKVSRVGTYKTLLVYRKDA